MKVFFLFFLFLPSVSALAVTPTSIDISDGSKAQVYIYNTLDKEMSFQVTGLYAENFSLDAFEVKILTISYAADLPGRYEGTILIQESYENGLNNAVVIPITYAGSFPSKSSLTLKSFFPAYLGLIFSVALGIYLWKKTKGRKKPLQKV